MVNNIFMSNDNDHEPIAKKIAFVHHKGGTGKTTSCLNIAGWLAKMKKKVLVVDLDPQGNATTGLGIDRRTCDGSIYDVFFANSALSNLSSPTVPPVSGAYVF
jgi:cellulose biosynthesis protein BcsQ